MPYPLLFFGVRLCGVNKRFLQWVKSLQAMFRLSTKHVAMESLFKRGLNISPHGLLFVERVGKIPPGLRTVTSLG
jgi:hypothetical protein